MPSSTVSILPDKMIVIDFFFVRIFYPFSNRLFFLVEIWENVPFELENYHDRYIHSRMIINIQVSFSFIIFIKKFKVRLKLFRLS